METSLIQALDPVTPEGSRPAGSEASGDGEFSGVLRSAMTEEESQGAPNANGDGAARSEVEEDGSAAARADSQVEEEATASPDEEEANAEAETPAEEAPSEAAEAPAELVAAPASVETARVALGANATEATTGAVTALDSEAGAGGQEAGRRVLTAEQAPATEVRADAGLTTAEAELGEAAAEGEEDATLRVASASLAEGEAGREGALVEEEVREATVAGEGVGERALATESGVAASEARTAETAAANAPVEANRIGEGIESARADAGQGDASPQREDGPGREGLGQGAEDRSLAQEAGLAEQANDAARSGLEAAVREEAVDATVRAPATVAVEGAGAVVNPVAGAVTETTPSATPGQPSPPVASEAIAVQTEWLATRGGGSVRLMLHPPELGEMAIRVTLRGGAVDVVMVAQEVAAQTVAEDQSERLASAFANRDLRMENFEVRRGNPDDLPNFDGENFAEQRGAQGESAEENSGNPNLAQGGGDAGAPEAAPPMNVPQILTAAGPVPGVDLRI